MNRSRISGRAGDPVCGRIRQNGMSAVLWSHLRQARVPIRPMTCLGGRAFLAALAPEAGFCLTTERRRW